MKPAPFDYQRPGTLAEALRLLDEDGEAKILAGGQSLLPVLNFRLAAPTLLIDINRVPGLDRISMVDDRLHLGAVVRWRSVEESAMVGAANPLLAEAVRHIAHYQIRNRGTVGGSCAHADPAAELPAVAVACEAEFVLQHRAAARIVAANDFFQGALSTALAPNEILTEIRFPRWPARRRWAFEEIAPRRGDFALLGLAALVDFEEGGGCAEARIVAFGTADGAQRLRSAEAALGGRRLDGLTIRDAARMAMDEVAVHADLHASADYRRAVTGVLVERTLERASRSEGAAAA